MRSQKSFLLTIRILLSATVISLLGCQDGESEEPTNRVYLSETGERGEIIGTTQYVLMIPHNYYRYPGRKSTFREFKFIYPELGYVPSEQLGWLVHGNGQKSTVVRVLLRYYSAPMEKKNDFGQHFYNKRYDELIRSGLRDPISNTSLPFPSGDFKCFDTKGKDSFGCAFSNKSGNYGVLSCNSIHCEVETTWQSEFSVVYQFSQFFLEDALFIDNAVQTMMAGFSPERVDGHEN